MVAVFSSSTMIAEHCISKMVWKYGQLQVATCKRTGSGAPVVPDVYIMVAMSSALGGTGSAGFLSPMVMNSSHAYNFTPCPCKK